MRPRTPLLLLCSVLALASQAQRARMDSLERALTRQTHENSERAHTLAALAKTCSTIDPERAFDLALQAIALAQKLKDDKALTDAWVSQRWAYYYLAKYGRCDSVNRLADTATMRSGDPRSWAITHGAPHYISAHRDPAVARFRFQRSLEIADSLGDHALAGEILYWNGTSSALLERAMAHYRAAGDSSGVAMCLFSLGDYEPNASDRVAKQRDLERATALFDWDGNKVWSIWAHGYLSLAASEQADYKKAVQEGLLTLDLANELGLARDIGGALDALATVYRDMGDLRTALTYHLRQFEHPLELDERLYFNNQVGRLYGSLGMPDSAIHYLSTSMRLLEETVRKNSAYRKVRYYEAQGYLADVLAAQGKVQEAAGYYRSALEGHDLRASAYQDKTWALLGYGRLLGNATGAELQAIGMSPIKARSEAGKLLLRALELGRELRMLKEQQDALYELARLYEREGNVNEAFSYQKQFAVMKDSVLNADKAKAVATLQIQYDTEKKEQQIVLLGKDKEVQAKEIQKQKLVRNGFMGGFALVALFAGVFLLQRNRISKARKRSDELLLNILPAEVAEELKAKGEAEAVHIDQVTVLFTDFKGFTAMSQQLTPKELVRDLHECFSAFDAIAEKYGIEKIKTIGDAYMAAGGLPTPNTTHATDVIGAALEMRDFISEGKAHKIAAGLPYFEIRIGIHTGPVVAGIVGVKKFQYDIWGDTVNTASRMESSGEVGQVNISEATYALVKDAIIGEDDAASTHRVDRDKNGETVTGQALHAFAFTARGKVQAKGKGEMEMYFVERKPAASRTVDEGELR
ncbi:MAG: adenylate/guanylate cyclase domain-containing protein [Flavobacteriales bacterium]